MLLKVNWIEEKEQVVSIKMAMKLMEELQKRGISATFSRLPD